MGRRIFTDEEVEEQLVLLREKRIKYAKKIRKYQLLDKHDKKKKYQIKDAKYREEIRKLCIMRSKRRQRAKKRP